MDSLRKNIKRKKNLYKLWEVLLHELLEEHLKKSQEEFLETSWRNIWRNFLDGVPRKVNLRYFGKIPGAIFKEISWSFPAGIPGVICGGFSEKIAGEPAG